MKIKEPLYSTMKDAVDAVVEHLGGIAKVRQHYKDNNLSDDRMAWDLWHVANRNLAYDDTHPAFKNGIWTRIHPHKPGFDIYRIDETIIDAHILTVLKAILKELGVLEQTRQ